MQRIPETELMNDEEQASAYAQADFAEPHTRFVELFTQKFPNQLILDAVLDLGCGPADISRRFAQAYPGCRVHGIDGAPRMLEQGRVANVRAGLANRIELFEINLPADVLPQQQYQTIISNSLLHHLHDPLVLWRSVAKFAAPGAAVFIMDLYRPENEAVARDFVQTYASQEPAVLREDFYASLCAAFTVAEISQQLANSDLNEFNVETVSDRHVIVHGMAP